MSEFLARKVKTYFKFIDVNHDGYISLQDFEELADRQSDATKANADEKENLKAAFVKVWRQWMKSAGSDDNGLLTASIFAESVKQQKSDPEFQEAYFQICHSFFGRMDTNGDGFLQEDEYAASLAAIGIEDTSIMSRAFEAIDLNGDGKLSLDEFCSALLEYITSEDENSRSGHLWGPLVE